MVRIVAALFGVLAAVSHVRAVSKGTTNVTCSADYDWVRAIQSPRLLLLPR
jgi:hypothetical protein